MDLISGKRRFRDGGGWFVWKGARMPLAGSLNGGDAHPACAYSLSIAEGTANIFFELFVVHTVNVSTTNYLLLRF